MQLVTNSGGTPATSKAPLKYRLSSMLARKRLQRFWEIANAISLRGMGYSNHYRELNGESRFLRIWAKQVGSGNEPVFDVGANEGSFALEVAQLLPNCVIHCFEPMPSTFQRLIRRLGNDYRYSINNVAVSAAFGTLDLYDYAGETGTTHASSVPEAIATYFDRPLQSITVPTITIDDYLRQNGTDLVRLLKIDVEGHEEEVLRGASESLKRSAIEVIQFEVNAHNAFKGFTLYKIQSVLSGYDIYKILPDGIVPLVTAKKKYDARHETFRYANLIAIHRDSPIELY